VRMQFAWRKQTLFQLVSYPSLTYLDLPFTKTFFFDFARALVYICTKLLFRN